MVAPALQRSAFLSPDGQHVATRKRVHVTMSDYYVIWERTDWSKNRSRACIIVEVDSHT